MLPQDQKARDRIRQDLTTSLLVEAGAGTGKTSLLIDRIAALLTQKKTAPEKIVALTFTEKAAKEIQNRLYQKLEDMALPFHRMFIGTIHAFAHQLLKEKAFEAGLNPDFILLDETQGSFFFLKQWNNWLRVMLTEKESIFFTAMRYGISLNMFYSLTQELYRYRDIISESLPQKIHFSFDALYETAMALSEKIQNNTNEHLRDTADLGYQEFLTIKTCLLNKSFERLHLKKAHAGNAKNWDSKESCAYFKQLMSELKINIAHYQKVFFHNLTVDLISKITEFFIFFGEQKKKRHFMDFDDLLIELRGILRDNPTLRNYWKNKFEYFLIDEFQDTDPLQMEIVLYICEKYNKTSQLNDIELQGGKLFIVGDPKQSIYRFRKADIEMYEAIKDRYFNETNILSIRQNFRSVSALIDFINRTFSAQMKKDSKVATQPNYIPLEPYHKEQNYFPKAIQILEAEALSLKDQRENEALTISSLIKKLSIEHSITYEDIAVIFPQTSDIFVYQDIFRRENIPHRFLEKEFYTREEIKSIINLLSLFKNPSDKIALIGTLKSDLFAVSDEQLFLLGNLSEYHSFLDIPISQDPHLAEVFTCLKKLYEFKDEQTVPQFLRTIFDQTHIHSLYVSQKFHKKKAYNLEKLIRKAYILSAQYPISLNEFTDWLINTKHYSFDELPLDEEIKDAVSFLTIHKAKGLEFKVVILANLFSERKYSPRVIVDRLQKHMAIKLASLKTYNYDEALEHEKKKDTHEMIRLLYVAMTRAKELLVIPYVKDKESLYYEIIREEIQLLQPVSI